MEINNLWIARLRPVRVIYPGTFCQSYSVIVPSTSIYVNCDFPTLNSELTYAEFHAEFSRDWKHFENSFRGYEHAVLLGKIVTQLQN